MALSTSPLSSGGRPLKGRASCVSQQEFESICEAEYLTPEISRSSRKETGERQGNKGSEVVGELATDGAGRGNQVGR
ncbi:hypothetical protein D7B24_004538 [Verticillium nonalfalfae]|uniref:Uncharacterized protein n=1 Tax=Verticillium nonalfalfae TaxID=1051616 RepID=A0A3M9XUT8_9PEZI|nr:uncharacterized protein D7B24_004538 [Verticillium nonalfalfae]RNJ52049.1 hypothetical protein D7B24_004538 [Verticillium nonalfalfae]